MTFVKEADFEDALIEALSHKGWEADVIKYPNEADLLANWAKILFDNNRDIDRLGDYPLTEGEMGQIMARPCWLKTLPLRTRPKCGPFISRPEAGSNSR